MATKTRSPHAAEPVARPDLAPPSEEQPPRISDQSRTFAADASGNPASSGRSALPFLASAFKWIGGTGARPPEPAAEKPRFKFDRSVGAGLQPAAMVPREQGAELDASRGSASEGGSDVSQRMNMAGHRTHRPHSEAGLRLIAGQGAADRRIDPISAFPADREPAADAVYVHDLQRRIRQLEQLLSEKTREIDEFKVNLDCELADYRRSMSLFPHSAEDAWPL